MLHRTWMVLIHTIPCRSYYAVGHCFPFGLCKLVGPASHVGRSYCYASPQTCRPCFVVERGSVPYGLCDLVCRIHFGRRLPLRLCQLVRRVYIIGPNFVACTSPQATSAVFNWTWFLTNLSAPLRRTKLLFCISAIPSPSLRRTRFCFVFSYTSLCNLVDRVP